MSTVRTIRWHSRKERQSSEYDVVGSYPTVGKNFSCCKCRFLCAPHIITRPLPIKSTVTYIHLLHCFSAEGSLFCLFNLALKTISLKTCTLTGPSI